MPAHDLFHDQVKRALIKDGWTITHDPFTIRVGERKLYVDLGAEGVIAAEKDARKIAIEIKSFIGRSEVADLERALGQYMLYAKHMRQQEPDRKLYLAVTREAFKRVFEDPLGAIMLPDKSISVLVFDEGKEEILQWIN